MFDDIIKPEPKKLEVRFSKELWIDLHCKFCISLNHCKTDWKYIEQCMDRAEKENV